MGTGDRDGDKNCVDRDPGTDILGTVPGTKKLCGDRDPGDSEFPGKWSIVRNRISGINVATSTPVSYTHLTLPTKA